MIGLTLLRDYLGLTESEHDDDDLIQELEASAVATVQSFTQFTYGPEGEVIEYVVGDGTANLYLSMYTSDLPTEVLDSEGTAVTDFVLRGTRLMHTTGVWTRGTEYTVTYTGGYGDGEEPADVRMAVMQIVALRYRGRGHEGFQSENVGGAAGGYSYTRGVDEHESIKEILALLPRRGVFA
jgi:hypothetical protein